MYRQIVGLSNYQSIILTQKRIHADIFPFDEKRVHQLKRPNGLVREARRFWYRKCKKAPWPIFEWECREIKRVLEDNKAELLHVYFGHIGMHLLPLLESKTRPCPIIVSFHGADVAVDMDKANYRESMKAVFAGADRILARSESLAQELRKLGCTDDKIRISRTGIPFEQWPLVERVPAVNGEWRLVQACRLIEKKGLDVTIHALAKIRQRHPRAQLTIIGEGPLKAELEDLAENLGIAKEVEFIGFVGEQRLREELERAHVFMHPSRTGKDGNQEGVPNAMLEAMATGLPVAATLHGGIPEAVEDGVSGILVEEDDGKTMGDRLASMLEDHQEWQSMGAAARKGVESQFAQEKQIADLEAIYQEVISE